MKRAAKSQSESPSPTRIFLVDDHSVMRRGLAELINSEPGLKVCGEATNLGEAYSAIGKCNPHLIIVDISLDGNDGIELTKELGRRWPKLLVLAYSMHDESMYAERALRAGAKGYVMKRHPPEVLLEAVSQVVSGKIYLSQEMNARMIGKMVGAGSSEAPARGSIESFTDRELEVFRLIGKGISTTDIAETLCLSIKTIETHRQHIKQKLKLQSSNELVHYAIEWSVNQS